MILSYIPTVYNRRVETSYVPPEVLAQAAADDQKDDQDDNQSTGNSNNFGQSDPASGTSNPGGSGLGDDSSGQLANALSGGDAMAGGEGGGQNNGPTLDLKEQFQLISTLISPFGWMQSILGGEAETDQQKQAEQEREAKTDRAIAAQQQVWQKQQAQTQQKTEALREQIEAIKSQAQGMHHIKTGSALKQRTTSDPAETDLVLTERSFKDASKEEAKHRQHGIVVPQGTQKGPVDFGTLSKQKSGMQKATELPMGE